MLIDLSNVATEQKDSRYDSIETLTIEDQCSLILGGMVQAVGVVKSNKTTILYVLEKVLEKWQDIPVENRRLYIAGAGSSGRLAAITAVEIAENKQFQIGFDIAGGPSAFQTAIEGAEDDGNLATMDISHKIIDQNAIVIGLSASGRTPYAIAYLEAAKAVGALTIAIDNSPNSPLSKMAGFTISNSTGPECPRGSTRMKAGTSQYATLQIFTRLLSQALCKKSIDEAFDHYGKDLDAELQSGQEKLINGAQSLYTHLISPQNTTGRIIYVGKGTRGLLGVIDGSELGPTYSWSRVAYATPALSKILGKEADPPLISPHDFAISLEEKIEAPCPQIDLSSYSNIAVSILLKTLTTLFALQCGWVLEGEMINLDPKNPNQKLIARRVQTLKNLHVVQTDEQAVEILSATGNNLAAAVIMHRQNTTLETAKTELIAHNNNVVQALRSMAHTFLKSETDFLFN